MIHVEERSSYLDEDAGSLDSAGRHLALAEDNLRQLAASAGTHRSGRVSLR
jgi:hypothetical protein